MPTLNYQEYTREVTYRVGKTKQNGPFAIPFPFYDPDTVRVFVNGVETDGFDVVQPDQYSTEGNYVRLNDKVKNARVAIWSVTGANRVTGETFVQVELSKEIDRLFANLQEMHQRGIWLKTSGRAYGAGDLRIANVGDPIYPKDTVNKGWVENLYDDLLRLLLENTGKSTEALTEFKRYFLGAFETDPITDLEGDTLLIGATYFNIPGTQLRTWDGTAWIAYAGTTGGTILPPILAGDKNKLVVIKEDETGYEYVEHDPAPVTPAGDSFILAANIDGPLGTDAHVPFSNDGGDASNTFVVPYDMTLEAASLRVRRNGGLRQDMTVSVRINGTKTEIFSEVIAFVGVSIAAPNIALVKGDVVEFVYTCANNFNMSVALTFAFTAGEGGGSSIMRARVPGFISSERAMFFGEKTSYNVAPAMPVATTLKSATYFASQVATVQHDIRLYVNSVEVSGGGSLSVGQQTLTMANLNIDLAVGDTFYASVDGNNDAGNATITFEMFDGRGFGGAGRPMVLMDFDDLKNPGDLLETIVMPFDATIISASAGSITGLTSKGFTVSVNGNSSSVLVVLDGTGPVSASNDALSIPVYAGQRLEFAHTGAGAPLGTGAHLSIGFLVAAVGAIEVPNVPPFKGADAGKHLAVNGVGNGLVWETPTAGTPTPTGESHRYWRILGLTRDNASYWSVAELEFRASVGGADMTNGNTSGAIASYERNAFYAANAFDRDGSTIWSPETAAGAPWIGYDFGAPVTPFELAITARDDSANFNQTPRDFELHWSDDGAAWTLMQTWTGVPVYSQASQKVFEITNQGGAAVEVGPPGAAGTSVVFGSNAKTAREGDLYYHTDGNIYLIITAGAGKNSQTLLGQWKAVAGDGWEPYGGTGTDPRFYVWSSNVLKIETPSFETGYDYRVVWKMRGSQTTGRLVVAARTGAAEYIDASTGGGQSTTSATLFPTYDEGGGSNGSLSNYTPLALGIGNVTGGIFHVGEAVLHHPFNTQGEMRAQIGGGELTFPASTNQGSTGNKQANVTFAALTPDRFDKLKLQNSFGAFTSGSYCELYRRKTSVT